MYEDHIYKIMMMHHDIHNQSNYFVQLLLSPLFFYTPILKISFTFFLLFYPVSFIRFIGPYRNSFFDLNFRPSSLTEISNATVVISNPCSGDLINEFSGVGLLPGLMSPVKIFCPLNEIESHSILFTNPFSFPLKIEVSLSGELCSYYDFFFEI